MCWAGAELLSRPSEASPKGCLDSGSVPALFILRRAKRAHTLRFRSPSPTDSATHPEFDTAYREARRAAFRQSVARLQQASGAAVTTLLKLMIDPATPPSTKARAADSVLDHSAKAIQLEDIEARIAELERAAGR